LSLVCSLYRDYSYFNKENMTRAERKVNDLEAL
jgi:hypothetical protein